LVQALLGLGKIGLKLLPGLTNYVRCADKNQWFATPHSLPDKLLKKKKGHDFRRVLFFLAYTLPQVLAEKINTTY
jgi:hypothetical protein